MPVIEEGASGMKLQIVPLRGRDKGRFGWVLYTDELLIQSRKTFVSKAEAEKDAAAFVDEPAPVKH